MSNRPDLLGHPDLSKVWVSLESAAPTLDLPYLPQLDLAVVGDRHRRSRRRLVAIAAAFLMVLFVGTETFGVVSARRAIAAGAVVTDGVIDLDIAVNELPEPWAGVDVQLTLRDLELRPEGIVAIASKSDGDDQSWLLGPDGWTMVADVTYPIDWGATVENGFITSSATDGQSTVFAGHRDSLLSIDGTPTLWISDGEKPLEVADIPTLRPLGFGYLIGGFRLSDGIEHVIHTNTGFVAYTGYLQVWDGFEDFSLEPREAWATLVLTSTDGKEWTPHILSDFAIYQMVPFGDGILAAAALPLEHDSVTIDVDGVATEVAAYAANRLYYSEDGLTWVAVADSPELRKPLLAPASDGTVIVVDEYSAEDRDIPTTEVFIVEPPVDTTG